MSQFDSITIHEEFSFDRLFFHLKNAFWILYQAYEEILKNKIYKKKAIGKVLEDTITRDLIFYAEEINTGYDYNFDIASVHPRKGNKVDVLLSYALGLGFEKRIGIECKVLEDNSRNSYYVSGGIERFITGYYSEKMPLAGMLGYVARGNINQIVKDINKRIDPKTRLQILMLENFLKNANYTYVSIHHRTRKLKDIRLYHIFLDFRKVVILS